MDRNGADSRILVNFIMPGKDPGGIIIPILLGVAGGLLG